MMKPPTHLNNHHTIVPSVEVRLVVYIVDNVLVSGVEEIIQMKFVLYAVMKLKNHSLMIQIQILSLILQIFSTHFHNSRHILNCPAFYDNDDEDDDEEYTIAITPVLPTVEPDNSLSMGDEHLSTIPEKKESSVEDLVPIPSESEGISNSMCDVHFCENSHPLDTLKDHSEIFFNPNDDYASSDDDPLYSEDIDYVDASPPYSELVSLEEVKDFDTEDGEIDTDILLTIKDDIYHMERFDSCSVEKGPLDLASITEMENKVKGILPIHRSPQRLFSITINPTIGICSHSLSTATIGFSQPDSSLVVPVFQKCDDPIDAINHMMSFLTAVVTSRYPTTNNQLRTSSNPRQQDYIYDGKVTMHLFRGMYTNYFNACWNNKKKYTPAVQSMVATHGETNGLVNCYYCKGEGHIAKQCTKPKRKRDETWFNDKVLLVQAQASDLDCDEITQPRLLLWQKLSRNGSDALTEVLNPDNLTYDLFNQSEQIMMISEQSNDVSQSETKITSDSNIIPYSLSTLCESKQKLSEF
ncbi:retrovirus-related pol polyprotein from transposon TNT 1-94 [Tanacetum coccineum]